MPLTVQLAELGHRLVVTCRIVEQAAVSVLVEQRLVRMLAMHVDQAFAELAQIRDEERPDGQVKPQSRSAGLQAMLFTGFIFLKTARRELLTLDVERTEMAGHMAWKSSEKMA